MSEKRARVAIVGNGVAAMFSALSLGGSGTDVVLVSPSRRLGGHFAGLDLAGRTFDAGMVFLEFTSFNADPAATIASYDPMRRNDVGRFMPLVERTLERFGEWRRVAPPIMRIDGRNLPDLLIANQLPSLHHLAAPVREKMEEELQLICARGRGPLHPSRKTADPHYHQYDLRTVSLANHGATFHERFIGPFCRKVTGRPAESFSAPYHRMAWLPLFYPETLLAELRRQNPTLPETVFSMPTAGTMSALVREVEQEVRALSSIDVIEGKVTSLASRDGHGPFTMGVGDGIVVHADRLVWTSDQDQLLRLCGQEAGPVLDRSSLVLASALVRADRVATQHSTLLVPEGEHLPFRVTNQSCASGGDAAECRFSLEWNAFTPEGGVRPALSPEQVRDALAELGLVEGDDGVTEVRVDVFKGALVLPTPGNRRVSAEKHRLLDELMPDVARIGSAAPFGATSFNDQVVQGLKVGEELGEAEATWH